MIHLRDVLYFAALVSTFLSATFLVVRGRTLSHRSTQYRNLQLGTVGLIVVSLLVGWSGNSIAGRLDLTEDQLFTLSPATSEILDGLDDVLTIEFFESREPPVQVAITARDVGDFLEDFAAGSDGQVNLVRRFPGEDEDEARKASLAGVPPVQFNVQSQGELQIKTGYLGMAMTYVDKRQVIPYINSFDGFEYRMASAANRMLSDDKKTVAFLTGHGEQGPTTGYRTFAGLLLDSYRVVELDTTEDPSIDLSEVDVLIIAGPNRSISDETTDAIRQYLLGGGKAMMLIDTVAIDQGRRLVATRNRNSFARLPEEFGVVVEEDLALDIESNETLSFSTQVGNVFLPYPFWVRAPVVDRKVSGNIESALLPWASSLGISESVHGRIETVNLLRTTPGAATISSSDASYGDVRPNAPIFNEVAAGERIRFEADMAVAVEQREASGGQDAFRLVVFGDSEWLSDGILGRAQENVALGSEPGGLVGAGGYAGGGALESGIVARSDIHLGDAREHSAMGEHRGRAAADRDSGACAFVPQAPVRIYAIRAGRRWRAEAWIHPYREVRTARRIRRRFGTGGRRVKSRQLGFVLMALIAVGVAGLVFRIVSAGSDEIILEGADTGFLAGERPRAGRGRRQAYGTATSGRRGAGRVVR